MGHVWLAMSSIRLWYGQDTATQDHYSKTSICCAPIYCVPRYIGPKVFLRIKIFMRKLMLTESQNTVPFDLLCHFSFLQEAGCKSGFYCTWLLYEYIYGHNTAIIHPMYCHYYMRWNDYWVNNYRQHRHVVSNYSNDVFSV